MIETARGVREQVGWESLRRRTEAPPFARAFLTVVLAGVAPAAGAGG